MVKNYLLDTNILLENPMSIHGFEDNRVFICGTTLQELDSKKNVPGDVGYKAREACRILDSLREAGDLKKGVAVGQGGTLIVEPDGVKQDYLPEGFSITVPDNRIISTCLHLNKTKFGKTKQKIILLTNDISMRVNASICGIEVQGVRNDEIEDHGYRGYKQIEVTKSVMEVFKASNCLTFDSDLITNEYAIVSDGEETLLGYCNGAAIQKISPQKIYGGVMPRNKLQICAIDALMDPSVPLVILEGPAGTAKTFLSLAAGLAQTDFGYGRKLGRYSKLLISRPNAGSTDPGFGYLPGDLEDKMTPLLANYYDNLEALMRGEGSNIEDPAQIKLQIEDLFDRGTIEMCPLNFIRGRSLYDSFIICDEAQNASKKLIRDVVTRAGEGTKVVISGDVRQTDVPTLDARNNGILYCLESMKGSPLVKIVRFSEEECVRSPLAEAALQRMR